MSLIKPQELFTASLAHLRTLLPETGDHLACDGKAIRSVEKSDEIPVLQGLLSALELDGRILAADAMHCQKEICQAVLKANGDYIFQVKAKQKGLFEQASSLLQLAIRSKDPCLRISETSERSRGRDEFRTTYLLPVLKEDDVAEPGPGFAVMSRSTGKPWSRGKRARNGLITSAR